MWGRSTLRGDDAAPGKSSTPKRIEPRADGHNYIAERNSTCYRTSGSPGSSLVRPQYAGPLNVQNNVTGPAAIGVKREHSMAETGFSSFNTTVDKTTES
jgi:hypothetical protein